MGLLNPDPNFDFEADERRKAWGLLLRTVAGGDGDAREVLRAEYQAEPPYPQAEAAPAEAPREVVRTNHGMVFGSQNWYTFSCPSCIGQIQRYSSPYHCECCKVALTWEHLK